MLDGKTVFTVANVPENAVLVRFNVLFAYIFDAITGAKGMVHLKIGMAKNQTNSTLMTEIFPAITGKCFAYEKLHLLNPRIVAYIHALIINSISVKFDETINARALSTRGHYAWGIFWNED